MKCYCFRTAPNCVSEYRRCHCRGGGGGGGAVGKPSSESSSSGRSISSGNQQHRRGEQQWRRTLRPGCCVYWKIVPETEQTSCDRRHKGP
ncbi:hypothetical protein ZHAS_00014138 [Anopheles sinensis]|uniref:Uncharacterized protein n=1 Tax=Anopheles sinensis TaxID=74873 RepID=A0A084W7Q5_ANOSI|nr:hypothetical protein ZHAS_00014138 [Anopheles sinensis]